MIRKYIKDAILKASFEDYDTDIKVERMGVKMCRMLSNIDPTREAFVLMWEGYEVVHLVGVHTFEDCDALGFDLADALSDAMTTRLFEQIAKRINKYRKMRPDGWEWTLLEDTEEWDGVKIVSDGKEVKVKCRSVPDVVLPESIAGVVDRLWNY